jgi:hypothetical protein
MICVSRYMSVDTRITIAREGDLRDYIESRTSFFTLGDIWNEKLACYYWVNCMAQYLVAEKMAIIKTYHKRNVYNIRLLYRALILPTLKIDN